MSIQCPPVLAGYDINADDNNDSDDDAADADDDNHGDDDDLVVVMVTMSGYTYSIFASGSPSPSNTLS